MDNVTMLDNPFSEGHVISSRGCMTDAKIAKLNNAEKRPAIEKKWEAAKMKIMSAALGVKDVVVVNSSKLRELLTSLSMTLVNYAKEVINNGAKKLRVNKIVNEKTKNIYDNFEKIDVVSLTKEVVEPKVEIKEEVKVENPLEPNIVGSREEIHGRHVSGHTGEIPVAETKEAIANEKPVVSSDMPSRAERNANIMANEPKETKAGDMDLYNNLLHNVSQEDDVSRQLQGAKDQLFKEEAKNKEISEQLIAKEKELRELEARRTQVLKMQEQKQKEEIARINNTAELLKEDTLEKTNNLISLKSQIASLKEELLAYEENRYEDSNSHKMAA